MPDISPIYLDHNATTAIDPRVAAAVAQCEQECYLNPASQHEPGRRARRVLEAARERIVELLGGEARDRLIVTSGATEANNLALLGLAGRQPGRVIVSAIEHPSVVGAAEELQRRSFEVCRLRVDAAGVVDLDHLDELLDRNVRLVSIMLGNHETGAVQPVAEAAARCRALGVPLHTDAVQAVGKQPVDFRALGAAALTLSGHKFHGPRGVGALLLQTSVAIEPIMYGGFQQMGLRPGTEFVPPVVGLLAALELWRKEGPARQTRMAALRDRFEHRLQIELPDLTINSRAAPRVPHTSNVAFLGLDRQALLMALDMAHVACSTGSACASGSSEPSPVLLAMRCDRQVVEGSLRFSLGAGTTAAEVDLAASRILAVVNELRSKKPGRKLPATSRH